MLLRATRDGKIERVPLENIKYASAAINNAPAVGAKTERGQDLRAMSITGLAFVNDEVFVAGLSKQEFASDLRRIAFPFNKAMASTSVEIFHTSHNKYETHAPITAFVPIKLKGVPTLLAGYGCAPLATFAIDALKDRQHVRGQTLAELGGGNRPLDMISFARDGKPVVIVANSSRTLMRIKTEDLEKQAPMTTAVDEAYVSAGAPYVSIAEIGVLQLDDLNAEHAVVIQRDIATGALDLRSLDEEVDVTGSNVGSSDRDIGDESMISPVRLALVLPIAAALLPRAARPDGIGSARARARPRHTSRCCGSTCRRIIPSKWSVELTNIDPYTPPADGVIAVYAVPADSSWRRRRRGQRRSGCRR